MQTDILPSVNGYGIVVLESLETRRQTLGEIGLKYGEIQTLGEIGLKYGEIQTLGEIGLKYGEIQILGENYTCLITSESRTLQTMSITPV